MLRVNSLFPRNQKQKQISIQTDFLLPKVQRKAQTSMNWKHSSGSMHKSYQLSQIDQNSITINDSHHPSLLLSNYSGFYRKKKDNKLKQQKKCIQTKGFKFLILEQNGIKETIWRHLLGFPQSKKDLKMLMKRINLPYFSRQSDKVRQSQQIVVVDIPEVKQLNVTVKQVIQVIKFIYEENNIQNHSKKSLFKKINLATQKVLDEISCLQIEHSQNLSKAVILKKYLKIYIKEMENSIQRKNYGNKNYLNKFYQEIYNRYQKNPFVSTETEVVQEASIEQESGTECVNNTNQKSEQLAIRKKATMNESFIKMRFYNNFRKEVQVLTANTEQILNGEMKKYSQI